MWRSWPTTLPWRSTMPENLKCACISGVGGKSRRWSQSAVRTADVGIDGCHLHCAKSCLENVGVEIPEGHHVKLYELGYKKRFGKSYDELR